MSKEITKEEIKKRKNDYKYQQYAHGGSRMFIDGESGRRHLLVDTYYDSDFAKYIDMCVKEYFDLV